jgi:hypothetical protein
MKIEALPFAAAALVAACGGAGPRSSSAPQACDAPRLAPAPERSLPAAVPSPVPPSTVAIAVDVDLARIRQELESQVPRRLAEERDRDVGVAGRVTYSVDRGPFTVGMDRDRAVVSTDVNARAAICKPLGPFGCPQYASCDPAARVRASIPLWLTPEYAFAPSSVAFDTTRRCLVTAANIDVTPMIEARARGETAKVQERVDRALPKLKKEVERAWTLLGTIVPAGKNGCLTLEPTAIVQGPSEVRGDKLRVRLGVVSQPRVESPCNPGAVKPLPPLGRAPDLGDAFVLDVPVRAATAEIERVLAEQLREMDLPAGAGPARFAGGTAKPTAQGLLLDLDVASPVCGTLGFLARPRWDPAARVVRFEVAPLPGEAERAGGLDVATLAQSLAQRIALALPVTDDEIRRSLSDRKVPVAPGEADLSVAVASVTPGEARVVPDGVEVRFAVRGSARIDVR